jgi:DNA-binding transcriptional regulator YiaG
MATLDQVFQRESAWIAACGDVDALMDKIQDWGDSIRAAERDGNMLVRMRAGDLVELAQGRIVRLEARAIRAEAARAAPAEQVVPKVAERRVEPRAVEEARAPEPAARRPEPESRPARRKVDEEAVRAAAEKVKADARIASAEADKIELQNKLLRAQVEAARRAASPQTAPTTAAKAAKAPTPERAVQTKVVAANGGPSPTTATAARQPPASRAPPPQTKPAAVPLNDNDGYTEADRLALAAVGHWPPTPRDHRGSFWSKHDDWPRDWTLTGGDLGRFRGDINLTRAVFAAQLGVPSALVKDAEMNPRERVGPALQIATRRAMDHAIQARRARREERAAAQAPPESAAAVVASVPAPVVVVPGASDAPRAFTGADLAGLRAQRRLSQREMADLLGVEQGTISKGEGKAGAALGPALQEALARLAAGGGAGGAVLMPE